MRPRTLAAFAVVMISLYACNIEQYIAEHSDDPEFSFVQNFFQQVSARDYESVSQQLADRTRAELTPASWSQTIALLPEGEAVSMRRHGADIVMLSDSKRHGAISFELEFEDGWAMGIARFSKTFNDYRITGFQLVRTAGPQAELNRFTLAGKSLLQYLVLLAAMAVPLFIVFTLVACARKPDLGHKGWWLFFILLGFCQMTVNWTTGEMGFQALSANLLGAGLNIGGQYGPWMFSVALPVGAILFWVRHRGDSPGVRPRSTPVSEVAANQL